MEQHLLTEGALHRSLVETIVEHKHDLLAEFASKDRQKDWYLRVDNWVTCCSRVLPLIAWKDHVEEPSIVPLQDGRVNYMLFLTRYQVRFRHKDGLHAGFHRRFASQLFEGLLRADRTLRDTLALLDANGDGLVSVDEFGIALANFGGKVLLPSQAASLYRTTAGQGGNVPVEDLLGTLSLHFSLMNPRMTTEETAFVPKLLDTIFRDILNLMPCSAQPQGVAVVLRKFFEQADTNGDGYLQQPEFLAAIQHLPSCKTLGEEQMLAVCQYIDSNGDQRINYAELLRALCVRHADSDATVRSHRKGPKALLEDMLETIWRTLHFEFQKPLRSLLRRLSPHGCTRCTPEKFKQALVTLNDGASSGALLSEQQIRCLVESLDVSIVPPERENHFDFEEFFDSFSIVDTLADYDVGQESDEDLFQKIMQDV
eukprot:TRINITY_DN93794_c0_g1_i1.p1 TRINITY_DN93794_c0_g1~~TRINITY_DN93794_c0_g1_i1.p1  ORF type:complete len:460 (+),score=98.14 TRINITY_DN93794_c0_g1_i1:102-1382(+)